MAMPNVDLNSPQISELSADLSTGFTAYTQLLASNASERQQLNHLAGLSNLVVS